jgi:hypothetical protein
MLNIEGRMRRRGDMKTRVLHFAEVLAGQARSAEGIACKWHRCTSRSERTSG